MVKIEFSKLLLLGDYLIMIILFILTIFCNSADFVAVDCAWIAQLGISSGAYYWKSRSDNRTKIPFKVIESLPEEVRHDLDLTEVIKSIIESQ